MFGTDHLLKELIELTREQLCVALENSYLLRRIARELAPEPATGLTITQIGDGMALTPLDPGATGIVFQANFTPVPNTPPNAGFTVTWADSASPALFTFTQDAGDTTGLTQDATIAATATVGATGTINVTVTGTFPDGTAASLTGTLPYTIGAPPIPNATGLAVAQTA